MSISRRVCKTHGVQMNRGLCDSCAYQRLVPNTRGSQFSLCERSRVDQSYPRYPRLPVRACPGHEPREGGASS